MCPLLERPGIAHPNQEVQGCTCSHFGKWLAIFSCIGKDPSVRRVLRECQEGVSQGAPKLQNESAPSLDVPGREEMTRKMT